MLTQQPSRLSVGIVLLTAMLVLDVVAAAANGVTARPSRAEQTAPASVVTATASLRAAIADLTATFADRYPHGGDYLRRLADLQRQMSSGGPADRTAIQARFEALQREALIANPLVSGQPIVFVVHTQYKPDHHNTATMFQTGEINTGKFEGGGALKAMDLATGRLTAQVKDGPK